ncbi:uncharacterized protein J4E88_002477 [Alternaria novae-zelandiae]|uniref:uncharacterized protein n=1 Tax=Alternaria novae-zelandiae TaxID=430562 RepID=UPI0020C3F3C2|nr:uncharacterized protein J4E88_002477 [Alternaria novae-zelandiae]KAI4691000.1 hypothetical protein J4E88_002477 [Alternaria novae-zelandiae]
MDKLPTEVLAEIVELLRDDRRDLLSVSYTNRKLHAIANDIIYSHYELYYHYTSLFIRALASNPNLQRCVQHIKWNSPIHDEGAFEFPRWITEAEFDQIKEKVGFPFPATWPRHATFLTGKLVEVNNWMRLRTERDLYLSTFMLFTPNVKELCISTKRWGSESMWFVQSLVGKIGTNLQKVILDGGANVVNLLPLFLLPKMKTLIMSDLLAPTLHEDAELEAINLVWARLEKEGSNLEHLEISHTTTDIFDLARLLKSLKNLKLLDYEFSGGGGSIKKHNRDVQTLFEAIGSHCASLNNMAIDDDRLVMNPGALEQLRGLENVETFQMTTSIFYEKVHCRSVTKEFLAESLQRNLGNLPKHLKNLRISTKTGYHDVTETFFDVLLTLGSAIKTLLPDLGTITFFGWHPQLGTFPCQTRIAALQSAFAQVGVRIVSEHDTIGDSERWYTKTRVGASSKIEEDYVWVHLLEDFEGEGENPWVARFGSSYRGDELNGDVWDSDEEDDNQEEGDDNEEEEDDNEDGEDSDGDDWEDEDDDDETPNPSAGGRPLNMQDIMEEMGILAAQGRMPGMPGMQPTNDDDEEDGDDGEEGSNTQFGPGRPLTMQDIENEMRIMMGQGLILNLPGMPGYRPEGGDAENEEEDDDEEEEEEGSNDSDAEQDEDASNNDNDNDNDPPPAMEPLPSASNLTLQEIEEKMKTMMAQERMFKLPGMPHFNPEDQYDSEEEEEEEEDEDDGFNYRWTV